MQFAPRGVNHFMISFCGAKCTPQGDDFLIVELKKINHEIKENCSG